MQAVETLVDHFSVSTSINTYLEMQQPMVCVLHPKVSRMFQARQMRIVAT